jgi:hypothetical protein
MPGLRGEWRLDYHEGNPAHSMVNPALNTPSDLLPWRFDIYSLYDCISYAYLDIRIFSSYEPGGEGGYEVACTHVEESSWPYVLSHNTPAHDPALREHHEYEWGTPAQITESNPPVGMHGSLSRILVAWRDFFQLLDKMHWLCSGSNRLSAMPYQLFGLDISDDLSKVMTAGSIVAKPGNPQWVREAIALWKQRNSLVESL